MKKCLVGLLVFSVWVFTGCTSYSFRGMQGDGRTSLPTDLTCKFRLASYSFSSQAAAVAGPWAIGGSSVDRVDTHALEVALQQLQPSLFTSDPSGLPIRVRVEIADGDADYSGLFPYFLSLGILPGRIICFHERGFVHVCLDDVNERLDQKSDIGFSSKCWLSVWTPLAAAMNDEPGMYSGENRHGTGIMTAPHLNNSCRKDEIDVFALTVAHAVIDALGQVDQNTLKRHAVLKALTEGH